LSVDADRAVADVITKTTMVIDFPELDLANRKPEPVTNVI